MYPLLETERLILRPWQKEDAVRLMDFAEVLNTTIPDNEMPQIRSLADAEWIVEDNIKDDNQWVIVYKPNNLMVGWFGMAGGKTVREKAAIWIWLDEAYWNRGIYGEALQKVVHFAFYGLKTATKARLKYTGEAELPDCCILSIMLPGYGHWSLYYKGKFYDPEFGVLDKLPEQAKLRYYWEVVL